MIFVTVGTHEQSFDRLVRHVDELKRSGVLTDEVIMQTGYCDYVPTACTWQRFFPYSQMLSLVEQADIIVTHGGPSSFIMSLQVGKVPIVVPRKRSLGEHVNDHQVSFAREVAKRQKNILVAEDMQTLTDMLVNFSNYAAQMDAAHVSNNAFFCTRLSQIAEELVK